MSKNIEDKVKEAIKEIKPSLQADGGDVEFVRIDNNIVKVKLMGACAGCPMSTMTVKWGIENYLKKKIPEIIKVETVQ